MSSPKTNIYNWKFKITMDPKETILRLESLLNVIPEAFGQTISVLGSAWQDGKDFFESCTFSNTEDGKFQIGNSPKALATKEVEIDILESENLTGIRALKSFGEIRFGPRKVPIAIKPRGQRVSEFRMHGHEKNNPMAIHVLKCDSDGLFLLDIRNSWEAVKRLESQASA